MEVETQTLSNFDLKAKPPFSYGINMPIDSSELHSLELQSCDLEMDALKSNGRESPVSLFSSKVESPVTYGQKCEEFVDVSEKSEVFGDSSELKSPVRSSSDSAVKLQKFYRGYRTRRKLADSAVVAEEFWWQAIDFARLNHSTISFFNFSKPETAALRWNRVSLNASKVGQGLSKDAQAQKLAFQHWIEAIDPRHRYGHSLHKYYEEWCKADAGQPFFYWLDIGDGKEIDLKECPRSKLRQQCIKYLGPQEREDYEYIVVEGKIVHKESGNPLDTNGAQGAKWIFVMSTFKKLYSGEKKKGVFHHSSFLAGGATLAAGRLVAEQGALKSISAYSGHYRPTDERLDSFLSFLSNNGVNLNEVQDQAVLDEQQREDLCRNVKLKTVKAKQDSELPKTSHVRSKNKASIGRSKFKHNLTEAEKEERKIRRILANRESARQTIRRRQAICDELTKKAADLSMENANLKREKELAQKEYESLKNINEYLKEQIAKPIKSKEVEIPSEPPKSTHVEISAPPPTSSPLLLYNHPTFPPFVWPFIIQSPNSVQLQHEPPNGTVVSSKVLMPSTIQSSNSVQSQHETQSSTAVSSNVPMPSVAPFSNPVQTQAQNAVVIPPRVPMPVFGNLNHSHEQENNLYVDGPKTPICLLPYHPWFFHIPNQGIGPYHQPSFSAKDKQFETSAASLSSQTVSYVESHHSSSPIQVKPEVRTAYNLNETPFGFPLDGGAKHVEAHPKGTIFKPTPLTPVISSLTTKSENGPTPGFSIKEATSSTVSHTASSLPRKNRVPAIYPCKTPEDVVAAAEARKRRKELTRLKNLRPFRINC